MTIDTPVVESTAAFVRQIAIAIATELRQHPERWFQGKLVRLQSGEESNSPDFVVRPDAVCWCLEGHILRRAGAFHREVMPAFRKVLDESDIYRWNDMPERIVADVIAICLAVAKARIH